MTMVVFPFWFLINPQVFPVHREKQVHQVKPHNVSTLYQGWLYRSDTRCLINLTGFLVSYFRSAHWRASWREGSEGRRGWERREGYRRGVSCWTSRTTRDPWIPWTTGTTGYALSLNTLIISKDDNKVHLHKVCIHKCFNKPCVCVCYDVAAQLTQMNVTSRKELLAHLDLQGYKGSWDRKVS